MSNRVAGLGLGQIRGDYAIINPALGAMLQVLRGFLLILWIFMLVTTVVNPSAVNDNAIPTTAVVVAVYALRYVWRLVTARLGVNRCYLCTDGVAVTGRLGRIRDSVAWKDVTGVQQMVVAGLVMGCHRIEIFRNGSAAPLWLIAPGAKSPLVPALLAEGRRSGVLE
ncbi:hypothetical protein [Streptomyces sp. NBC_00059]|uniref:hypothetical protein n=1 Tax=Streptomyces sp. NBC_00059 TaxID=2975635 RepID=UPI00224E819E|nr:hypothetical protein [Streptomyces sp. NBC_00059]MCX5416128.1 hypothetical protein [Streptomyces sp. NBC_00059]